MKILIIAENLKKGIVTAERVVGKNLTLPILSNVLLEAQKGKLQASATNLEIGVVCTLRAKIDKEGSVAVPARLLGSFLANIPDEEKVALEIKDQVIHLSYSGNKASIKGMDAKDFPLIPKAQSEHLFELEAEKLKIGIQKTIQCAASQETRQELTGVYFELKKDGLILAATDSFRLAEYKIKLNKDQAGPNYERFIEKNDSMIIPAKTLQEVARTIDMGAEKVRVLGGESQIFFEVGDAVYVSRLIDGKYPEYKQVIPKQFASSLIIKKENLLKSVKMASVFSDSQSREVRLRIKSGKEHLFVSAQSVESGDNLSEVPAKINSKDDTELAFNSRYLLDGLTSISSEMAYIGFNDNFGPVIFREVDGEEKIDERSLHIVMPIRS